MKKALQLALGILTAIGGFFDIGNLATASQAGAQFRFQLLWALLVGTLIVILLVEMAGRYAAVTHKALPEAIREHVGARVWVVPMVVLVLLHLLTLAAEIGGVAFAMQLLTGLSFQIWAIPVGILIWLFLWRATFDAVEYSTATLGLITLCFVVAMVKYHPSVPDVLKGVLPSLPAENAATYWLFAVSIVGALIAPYLFYFYSSGAIEDKWDRTYIGVNRLISVSGMTFGAAISAGVMIVAAMMLHPRHIQVSGIDDMAFMLTETFPFWGFALFAISMGVACVGAASEVGLSTSYTVAQTLGWRWGQSLEPAKDARFATVYTGALLLGSVVIALGLDPFKLTIVTMALNATVLPVVTIPFLLLMNDGRRLRQFRNGPLMNIAAALIVVVSLVLFLVSVPLLFLGS